MIEKFDLAHKFVLCDDGHTTPRKMQIQFTQLTSR